MVHVVFSLNWLFASESLRFDVCVTALWRVVIIWHWRARGVVDRLLLRMPCFSVRCVLRVFRVWLMFCVTFFCFSLAHTWTFATFLSRLSKLCCFIELYLCAWHLNLCECVVFLLCFIFFASLRLWISTQCRLKSITSVPYFATLACILDDKHTRTRKRCDVWRRYVFIIVTAAAKSNEFLYICDVFSQALFSDLTAFGTVRILPIAMRIIHTVSTASWIFQWERFFSSLSNVWRR